MSEYTEGTLTYLEALEDVIEDHDYATGADREGGGKCPERICWCHTVRAVVADGKSYGPLIAAAPELLQAAKAVLNDPYVGWAGDHVENLTEAERSLLAAIHKAEGRE